MIRRGRGGAAGCGEHDGESGERCRAHKRLPGSERAEIRRSFGQWMSGVSGAPYALAGKILDGRFDYGAANDTTGRGQQFGADTEQRRRGAAGPSPGWKALLIVCSVGVATVHPAVKNKVTAHPTAKLHLIVWNDWGGGRGYPDVTRAACAGSPDRDYARRFARICRTSNIPQYVAIGVILLTTACDADRDSNSRQARPAPQTSVTTEEKFIAVPDLTGMTGDEAKAALAALAFRNIDFVQTRIRE